MKEYRRITRGRRAGQVASPWRAGVRPECIHEYNVSELLEVIYDYYDLNPIIDRNEVVKAYKEIAGEMISNLTTDITYADGVLTLRVASAALRHEILQRRTNLQNSINSKIGRDLVSEIKVF